MKLNSYLVKSTIVAALGMTVASALWGTILGSMLAGIPGEKFGRRDSLRATAVL